MKSISISEEEYKIHEEDYDGICIKCGEWKFGGCEPDARNYKCDECGNMSVFGTMEAMISGFIDIGD